MPDLSIRGAFVLIDAYLATDPGEWHPYVGVDGAQGWQNSKTGRVIYQDERPGVEGAGEPPLRTSGAKPQSISEELGNLARRTGQRAEAIRRQMPPAPIAEIAPDILSEGSRMPEILSRLTPDRRDRARRAIAEYDRLIADPDHPLNRPDVEISERRYPFARRTVESGGPRGGGPILSSKDHELMVQAHQLAEQIDEDIGNEAGAEANRRAIAYHEEMGETRRQLEEPFMEDDDLMSPGEREQLRIEEEVQEGRSLTADEKSRLDQLTSQANISPEDFAEIDRLVALRDGPEVEAIEVFDEPEVFREIPIADTIKHLLGPDADLDTLRSVFADPDDPDWEINIDHVGRKNIEFSIIHPEISSASRTLKKDHLGNTYLYSDYNRMKTKGTGFGAKFFARQVEGCRKAGIKYIENLSARSESMNGYYTWPRFGYDAPLTENYIDLAVVRAVRAQFPDAKTLLDVMATPEGREWWKENGGDISPNRFDCSSDDSRSMQVLRAYQEELANKPPRATLTMGFAMTTIDAYDRDSGGDEIDLSPEDEAALERAWAKIQARWANDPQLAQRIRRAPRPISPAALSILLTTQPSNWKPHKGQDGKQAGWQNLTTGEIVYESVRPGRPDTSQPPPATSGPHPAPPVARKPRVEPAPLPSTGRKATQLQPPAPQPQPQPAPTPAETKRLAMISVFEQHPKVESLLGEIRRSEERLREADKLPEMEAFQIKLNEFRAQKKLAEQVGVLSRQFFLNSCKLPQEKRAPLKISNQLSPERDKAWGAAINYLSHVLGANAGPQDVRIADVVPYQRSQLSHYDSEKKAIYLDWKANPAIAAHEFGHFLEDDKWAHQRVMDFRMRRFPKEKDVDMSQKFPGRRYQPGTIGNPDELEGLFKSRDGFNADTSATYAGLVYPQTGQTEVLSMGLQLLYQDPIAFAKEDPEYFALVMSILQDDRGREENGGGSGRTGAAEAAEAAGSDPWPSKIQSVSGFGAGAIKVAVNTFTRTDAKAMPNAAVVGATTLEAYRQLRAKGPSYATVGGLWQAVKAAHPETLLSDFQRQMLQWQDDDLLTLQKVNDPHVFDPETLAATIFTDRGNFGFVHVPPESILGVTS